MDMKSILCFIRLIYKLSFRPQFIFDSKQAIKTVLFIFKIQNMLLRMYLFVKDEIVRFLVQHSVPLHDIGFSISVMVVQKRQSWWHAMGEGWGREWGNGVVLGPSINGPVED